MKKCAVINDLSGFGKCSLSVALPIISVMGSEAHSLPTAVLSNQTAYDSFYEVDLTEHMLPIVNEWCKLGAYFDAILTGFVTNEHQIDIINMIIDKIKGDDTLLIVDPVMADNGVLYDGYTQQMCEKIKALCYKADIITPNIAELAFIAEKPYCEELDTICEYAINLLQKGIKSLVVTGYKNGDEISNIVFDKEGYTLHTARLIGGYYSGTGDITASVITGGVLRGMSLNAATELATAFISRVIENTSTADPNEGIEFEKYLGDLL